MFILDVQCPPGAVLFSAGADRIGTCVLRKKGSVVLTNDSPCLSRRNRRLAIGFHYTCYTFSILLLTDAYRCSPSLLSSPQILQSAVIPCAPSATIALVGCFAQCREPADDPRRDDPRRKTVYRARTARKVDTGLMQCYTTTCIDYVTSPHGTTIRYHRMGYVFFKSEVLWTHVVSSH